LASAGASAAFMALLVKQMLQRGGATRNSNGPPQVAVAGKPKEACKARETKDKRVAMNKPRGSLSSAAKAVLGNPVLLALMLCNSLSYFASKCTKEWGAIYLRGTGLAATDLQAATLLFWAEVGASAGAGLSGFASLCCGGRHALTCFFSAWLAVISTGLLALGSSRWKGPGSSSAPMRLGFACALQACSLAGINAVRTLAGLHAAEVASRMGMVGMANGWMEIIGQMGSIVAGQPVGALAARVASTSGTSAGAEVGIRKGWTAVLAALTLASGGLAALNSALLPQENRRLVALQNKDAKKSGEGKRENADTFSAAKNVEKEMSDTAKGS